MTRVGAVTVVSMAREGVLINLWERQEAGIGTRLVTLPSATSELVAVR